MAAGDEAKTTISEVAGRLVRDVVHSVQFYVGDKQSLHSGPLRGRNVRIQGAQGRAVVLLVRKKGAHRYGHRGSSILQRYFR